MSHSDPRRVVRVAIALAVLKHRPRDQSIASHLLDLQSRFPVATKHDTRDWRAYALELEKQLATLKTQRDADQELLSKLPNASQVASTSDAPPKKKIKKNPARDQHDPEWSWDQSRADWSRILSSQYPSSPSLVAAYGSLRGVLASPNSDLLSYASRLVDAILRTLDTIHLFLFSPTNPSLDAHAQTALGAPRRLKPEHIDSTRIALASPLLLYLLRTVLHTLTHTAQDSIKSKRPRQRLHTTTLASTDMHAHVDKVLDHVLECILLPLLRAMTPLCSARFAALVSAPVKKDVGKVGKGKDKDKDKRTGSVSVEPRKETDVRTDVFALIGTSLEALDALPPFVRHSGPGTSTSRGETGSIASGIRHRLGLETIRELEALYAVSPAPVPVPVPVPPPPPSALQPPSQQLPPEPLPPLPTPTPTPLTAQSQSQTHSQPHLRAQRCATPESRAKRLQRLVGTRAERVRALATRDAGWFLASTLNLCVTPAPAASTAAHGHGALRNLATGGADTSEGLLREALLDRVGKLVRSVHVPLGGLGSDGTGQPSSNPSDALGDRNATDKLAIDPVCQNMLLAICERAMSHLVSA